ncbi:MAG TPA: hypothetical protein VFI02_22500 [Armatimonadota bacterium]|nr:hypothetical protein [Armatimonadota bacterium]
MMGRHVALFLVVLGVLAGTAFGASDKLAPYKPFDEPKPKLPNEILTDSRLDRRVKVFVKSKNLRQLFDELSAKTDVKLLTNQKLWGERAIIYFHDRPLRDVMTEVANLFGYHWSVKGFPGHYRYELYEDARHAKRRDELRQKETEAQNELLLDYLKKLAAGTLSEEALKRLQSSDPMRYRAMTYPTRKDDAGLFMQLGEPFLRKVFTGNEISSKFADFPQQWQAAMLERANRMSTEAWNSAKEEGFELPEFVPFVPEDMALVTVDVRLTGRSPYYGGSLELEVNVGDKKWFPGIRVSPPRQQIVRDLIGLELASAMGGEPLPEKPEITTKELRWLDFRQGLLLGDVLQGIGEQSAVDVIADYHYQPKSERGAVRGISPQKLVASVCQDMDYSSRFDGKTIRLRFNKWYIEPLCEEPPASLIERCWKSLEDNGCISLDVQMDMASLPDNQLKWPGFRFIHGAFASYAKDSLRFLKALGPELRTMAQSEKGLPASSLMPDQYNQFVQWAATLKSDIQPSDLQQSVIALKYQKIWNDDGGNNYKLILNLPDGSSYPARISVIELEGGSRKGMPEWHRKDLKADVIEVLD